MTTLSRSSPVRAESEQEHSPGEGGHVLKARTNWPCDAPNPNNSDTTPTGLAAEVLDVLEQLDDARLRAKNVLEGVFLRLMAQRYPIGTLVEIEQVSVYSDIDGATHAKVIQHLKPEIFIEQPEISQLVIDCAPLRRDGSETGRVLRFRESVLGRGYWSRDAALAPRAQLMKLIGEMHAVLPEPSGPTP